MALFNLPENFVPKVEIDPKVQLQREGFEYYAIPADAVADILQREPLSGSILDPSAGQGQLVKALKNYYPNSDIVGTDLAERENDGSITCGIDFLTYDYGRKFDNIVMNPIFGIAKEYIERALKMANKRVYCFLKINFLEGVGRKDFLENSPLHYIYVFSRRVSPLKNGCEVNEQGKDWHSTMCFAWYIWDLDYTGEPIIRWI